MDGTKGNAATVDPAMVRRDGTAMYRIRHHGHIDHGAGEACRVGRFGVEGQFEGGTVELSHLFAGDHDARVCYTFGMCWDALWQTCLLPFLCGEDV